MILFLKITLILLNLYDLINADKICGYDDCFNCTVCGTTSLCQCDWNPDSKICFRGQVKSNFFYNYEYFDNCKDDISSKIKKYYCGNSQIKLNDDNSASIQLVEINGKYGAKSLYCEYVYEESTDSKNIYYNLKSSTSSSLMDHVKIYISISFYDDTSNTGTLTNQHYEKEFKNLKNIKIQVYCDQQLSSNPFLIEIEKKETKFNYTIFISVGIIVLACIICVVIIYCFSRKAKENSRRQQMLYLQMAMENQRRQRLENFNGMQSSNYGDVASSSESEMNITEENRQKIEKLLQTELAPIKYHRYLGFKDGNACTVCTIYIEDFKIDISKVSITPCQHVFHYICLSNWLMQNLLHPKCPNCNYNLLQEKKK